MLLLVNQLDIAMVNGLLLLQLLVQLMVKRPELVHVAIAKLKLSQLLDILLLQILLLYQLTQTQV